MSLCEDYNYYCEDYNYYYGNTGISIKDVQAVELEMLIEFDRICRKNNIPYQLNGGTLLGAVRHKGFIPWDDDIDVALKRSDYEFFLKCCEQDLSEQYFLQTCFTDPASVIQFAKIRKNGTKYENDVDNLPTSHTGIWLDIFPFDNVKAESLATKWQRFEIQFFYAMTTASVENRIKLSPKLWKRVVRRIFSWMLYFIPKNTIDKKLLSVFKRYDKQHTENVTLLCDSGTKSNCSRNLQNADTFNDLIELEFCGHLFWAPRNYDLILTRMYGDYLKLPPKEKRTPWHGITVVKI